MARGSTHVAFHGKATCGADNGANREILLGLGRWYFCSQVVFGSASCNGFQPRPPLSGKDQLLRTCPDQRNTIFIIYTKRYASRIGSNCQIKQSMGVYFTYSCASHWSSIVSSTRARMTSATHTACPQSKMIPPMGPISQPRLAQKKAAQTNLSGFYKASGGKYWT